MGLFSSFIDLIDCFLYFGDISLLSRTLLHFEHDLHLFLLQLFLQLFHAVAVLG